MENFVSFCKTKYVRLNPCKGRLVANMVRGKDVKDAMLILDHSASPKVGVLIKKTLMSALANAENKENIKSHDLYISKICIDKGPYFKRGWPRNKGRVSKILKKNSHISIYLGEVRKRRENIGTEN